MRSRQRLVIALAATLMMTSCASSPPPVTALQRPLLAAALQLCPPPDLPPDSEVDDVAATLMDLYGLYGLCAGMHADLVRAVEGTPR